MKGALAPRRVEILAIIVQNMPARIAAANHMFNTAPKDGTTIALIQRGMLLAKFIYPGGVRFDIEKFNWLGSLNSETAVTLAWHTAAYKAAKDLFERELIVGGITGVDPETTPKLYNSLIGTAPDYHVKIAAHHYYVPSRVQNCLDYVTEIYYGSRILRSCAVTTWAFAPGNGISLHRRMRACSLQGDVDTHAARCPAGIHSSWIGTAARRSRFGGTNPPR